MRDDDQAGPGSGRGAQRPPGVVERYLSTMNAHDWEAMGACVAPDVVRVGPFGDTYTGREEYVAFLSGLLPTLRGYSMEVSRITYTGDGSRAVAELSETVEVDGRLRLTPEALVFDLDSDGLIAHLSIYVQRLGAGEGDPS